MTVSYKGEVFTCKSEIGVFTDTDDNSLFIAGNIRPVPQPRVTYRSRYANKYHKKYIEWRNNMRDIVRNAIQHGVTQTHFRKKVSKNTIWFPDEYLELSAFFGAKPSDPTRTNKDGSADKRTINDIYNSDLANYVKAWEDVMNGIVYKDDKQIRQYDKCKAVHNNKNFYWIHLKPITLGRYLNPHTDIKANL